MHALLSKVIQKADESIYSGVKNYFPISCMFITFKCFRAANKFKH